MQRSKALTLSVALASALALMTPQASQARAFGGWHGGGWGGGWHGGWGHRGGWGWGAAAAGVGVGLAAGALAAPYYGYGYGYGYPGYAYGYGDCYLTRRWGPYGPHLVRVCY